MDMELISAGFNEDSDEELYNPTYDFHITLSIEEKIKCLEEIVSKLNKILYVYDKSQEPNSTYNYKVYCGGILIYVSSSNTLFEGELVNLVVNINAIITNDFEKSQIKRVVFESKNFAKFLLEKYRTSEKNENGEYEDNESNETYKANEKYGEKPKIHYTKKNNFANNFDYRESNYFNGKVGD